jgi:adenosine deaminase
VGRNRHSKLLLLALSVVAFLFAASPAAADTNDYLDSIRGDRIAFSEFMEELPKGGDIHSHLSGAVYAESMIGWGAEDGVCVSETTFVANGPPCAVGDRPLSDALTDGDFYNDILAAWSMRGFVPGEESGHDHFFATFDKFGGTLDVRKGDALAEVASRAASQNVHYLELLSTFQFGAAYSLSENVDLADGFEASRQALLDAGMANTVAAARTDIDGIFDQFEEELGCGTPEAADACDMPIRFDYQGLRQMPPEVVFSQLVLAFELMEADPRVVGVNLVQPEDAVVGLRDYTLQMRMIGYLRDVYEGEHVTLHAGELVPGLVPPKDLRFHINQAVKIAKADRIGHGVSIRHEKDSKKLMKRMARRDVLVEQCLTSNKQILEVSGKRHSFPVYRRYGVPLALCTDDEGVSRTDLTEQYEIATRSYDLSYRELKEISRNSLSYGFLQGEAKRAALRELDAEFRRFERRYR